MEAELLLLNIARARHYRPVRKVIGRIAITNYELRRLSNEERNRLNEEIQRYPRDSVFVDIRPGYPGGDFPCAGRFSSGASTRLSVSSREGLPKNGGFYVEKDLRTGPVMRNPAHVLDIEEASSAPADTEFSVNFAGSGRVGEGYAAGCCTPTASPSVFLSGLFGLKTG